MTELTALDHLVLTVADVNATVRFYRDTLGMQVDEFVAADGSIRLALKFGTALGLNSSPTPIGPYRVLPICALFPTDHWTIGRPNSARRMS
jgi:catechol 2,3-dioxygenase-like lactoylglutathione lyase family enzyme